jgi:hypothetical protein
MKLDLAYGDIFFSENPQSLGKVINFFQTVKAPDDESNATHSGIIQSPYGKTIEAVWKITEQDLYEAYKGVRVCVMRWHYMTELRYGMGMGAIRGHLGESYPYFRLLLHAVGLAKYIHWRTPVCSELTAKFLMGAGERKNWWGWTPDALYDSIYKNREWDLVHEGVL